MAYLTWELVTTELESRGEKRMLDILGRGGDTAEAHPNFDRKRAIAERIVDNKLTAAGYVTPLEEPADEAIRNCALALFYDAMTKTTSSRESWIDAFATWAMDYLNGVVDGSHLVDGAEEIVLPVAPGNEGGGALGANFRDHYEFDRDDLNSEVHHILPTLGTYYRDDI